ncbi:MAG TPA: hypothetical protein VFB92_26270 [Vicinamibacterales bacterium]|jgi:hypothetical protein|nr:hypothetical protein [Vicinamibacterales bacterium]
MGDPCVTESVNTGRVPMAGDRLLAFYVHALGLLEATGAPFLVGGAFAHSRYTGRDRETKDLDVVLRREDVPRVLAAFSEAGYHVDVPFPHWLGKVRREDQYIDVVFSSGNGIVRVDDRWFIHAVSAEVLGIPVSLCPPEELLWSSSFVQERERYDGAAVLHLLHAQAAQLDWNRLLERFGENWPVLLSYLILFQFTYPDRRADIPDVVMSELTNRLQCQQPEPDNRVCRGTLLSRQQYLFDLDQLGYTDARLRPHGAMTPEQAEIWTRAIETSR